MGMIVWFIGCGIVCMLSGIALIIVACVLKKNAGAKTYIVGKDVPCGKIREFYYTVSSTGYPPHFLRYRFGDEQGKKTFFFERREGDHLPLTEEDRVETFTKELTDVEWTTFLNIIGRGTVRKRKESTASGGSGPYLFLYWEGDRGCIQEYGFPSYEEKEAFVAFSESLRK